jgi:hypothetical protein
VEKKLFSLPEHLSSLPFFCGVCGARYLVFCVDHCLSLCLFFLTCHSSIFYQCRNTTGKSFSIPRNGSAVLIGHLQCNGGETDIGLCRGDFDKSSCNDDVVALDGTGTEISVVYLTYSFTFLHLYF